MGRSWTIAIEIRGVDRAKWEKSKATPAAYDDWPALLEGGSDAKPIAVSKLLVALEKDKLGRFAWSDDHLSAATLLDDDGSFWIDRRALLAAAIRSAGAFGGEGELAIVNALDNTEETAIVVSAGGGAKALTGAKRTALQKRLGATEKELGEAATRRAAEAAAANPFVQDELLRPVHARIIAALREADPARVLAVGKKSTRFILAVPTQGLLGTLYEDGRTLIDAVERGDARVIAWQAGAYAAISLELLDGVDPSRAATLAKEVLAAASDRKIPAAFELVDVAFAIATRAEGVGVAEELAVLRRALLTVSARHQHRIKEHPLLLHVASRPGEAREVVLAAVSDVLGEPGAWKPLTDTDAMYGAALAYLLERVGTPEDAALLAAFDAHPHWQIFRRLKRPT